jgi:hypothetical protein
MASSDLTRAYACNRGPTWRSRGKDFGLDMDIQVYQVEKLAGALNTRPSAISGKDGGHSSDSSLTGPRFACELGLAKAPGQQNEPLVGYP